MIKKTLRNTIGVSIGAVGIGQATAISGVGQWGNVLGTAMAGGMVKEVSSSYFKKKKR